MLGPSDTSLELREILDHLLNGLAEIFLQAGRGFIGLTYADDRRTIVLPTIQLRSVFFFREWEVQSTIWTTESC